MLTAINFAVNFLCKLSSVGTVDVVDVVKDLCVCVQLSAGAESVPNGLLGSSLKATLTKLNNYYEQVHHISFAVRPYDDFVNLGTLQSAVTCSHPINFWAIQFINVCTLYAIN